MKSLEIVGASAMVLALVSCGSEATGDRPTDAPPRSPGRSLPTDIECPSGYSGGTAGGEYQEENPPEGYATPEVAARAWLDAAYPRSDYAVVADGLFVLRDDGTARARAFWMEGREDYLVDGYRACAPAPRG